MADITGVLGSMASLIIVTVLGYIAARAGFLTAEIRPKLSSLIFNVTLPCTVLASVGEVDSSTGGDQIVWSIILGFAIFFAMLIASAIAVAVLRVPRDERHLYLFQGVLTNTGFIGFAVLESIFGGASVFLGSIFIAVSNVFLYSIGVGLLTAGSSQGSTADSDNMNGSAAGMARASDGATGGEPAVSVARTARLASTLKTAASNMLNVPLIVSLIAMVIFFAGIPVPDPIMQAADMAGGVTAPLAMMLVGLSIADADLRSVLADARLWGFTIIRFLVAPIVFYLVLKPIVPSELALSVFTVLFAMPTGSMAGPMAETYGQDGDLPARGTIISTIASFVIVPIIMLVM